MVDENHHLTSSLSEILPHKSTLIVLSILSISLLAAVTTKMANLSILFFPELACIACSVQVPMMMMELWWTHCLIIDILDIDVKVVPLSSIYTMPANEPSFNYIGDTSNLASTRLTMLFVQPRLQTQQANVSSLTKWSDVLSNYIQSEMNQASQTFQIYPQNNTIVLATISTIKRVDFHPSSFIIGRVGLFG